MRHILPTTLLFLLVFPRIAHLTNSIMNFEKLGELYHYSEHSFPSTIILSETEERKFSGLCFNNSAKKKDSSLTTNLLKKAECFKTKVIFMNKNFRPGDYESISCLKPLKSGGDTFYTDLPYQNASLRVIEHEDIKYILTAWSDHDSLEEYCLYPLPEDI